MEEEIKIERIMRALYKIQCLVVFSRKISISNLLTFSTTCRMCSSKIDDIPFEKLTDKDKITLLKANRLKRSKTRGLLYASSLMLYKATFSKYFLDEAEKTTGKSVLAKLNEAVNQAWSVESNDVVWTTKYFARCNKDYAKLIGQKLYFGSKSAPAIFATYTKKTFMDYYKLSTEEQEHYTKLACAHRAKFQLEMKQTFRYIPVQTAADKLRQDVLELFEDVKAFGPETELDPEWGPKVVALLGERYEELRESYNLFVRGALMKPNCKKDFVSDAQKGQKMAGSRLILSAEPSNYWESIKAKNLEAKEKFDEFLTQWEKQVKRSKFEDFLLKIPKVLAATKFKLSSSGYYVKSKKRKGEENLLLDEQEISNFLQNPNALEGELILNIRKNLETVETESIENCEQNEQISIGPTGCNIKLSERNSSNLDSNGERIERNSEFLESEENFDDVKNMLDSIPEADEALINRVKEKTAIECV